MPGRDTRSALQSLPSFPQQLFKCPLWDEWVDEVLFPWHRLFQNWGICPSTPSILPDPGLPILCPPSLWSDNDPWPGVINGVSLHVPMAGVGGVSEDRVVSAFPPAHSPSLHLRGAQKSLSRGMCKARATPRSPHQQSTTETGVLGDPWPLMVHQEAGPGGSPCPPPCFTGGGNSKHRANQAIFQTEQGSASRSKHRTNPGSARGHGRLREQEWLLRPSQPPPTLSRACGGPGDGRAHGRRFPRLSRKPPFCREKLMKGRSLGNYELPPAISPSKESGGMAD